MTNFHRISRAEVLDNYTIIVEFINGEKVRYNIEILIDNYEMFKPLKDKRLFNQCKVDKQGYGLYWNDDIDISCNELWDNGERIN